MEKGILLAPLSSDASQVLLYAFVLIHYSFQPQDPAGEFGINFRNTSKQLTIIPAKQEKITDTH